MTLAGGEHGDRGVPCERGRTTGLGTGNLWTQKTLRPLAPRTTIAPRADGALRPSHTYFPSVFT
jgi:hypothetical protein